MSRARSGADDRRPWQRLSLVARFTLVCLALILVVGIIAAQAVASELRSTALSQEAQAVAFDASARIEGLLRPDDLRLPLTGERVAQIDRLVRERALGLGTLGMSLWRADHVIAYSTDSSSIAKSDHDDPELDAALAGRLTQSIKRSSAVDIRLPSSTAEVMEVYVPLRLGGPEVVGAFELYRDLADVNGRIATVRRSMVMVLGGGLAVLLVALLMVVRGASRQLQTQSETLAHLAARQEVARLQTEFVGVVSHELRTPLTALVGFSELLLGEDVADHDRREWTELLHSGAQHLRHLVEQLLDVSRIDESRLEVHLTTVSVQAAAAEALRSFTALPPGIEITRHFEKGLPPVLADHERLVQILTNLLSNAVKYSPDGGEVALTARRLGRTVQVNVVDHGLGIPPTETDRIFERFYRVDDERRRSIEGTGLGLYITRQLVQLLGGTITVHSLGERRGSAFTVTLPVAPPAARRHSANA
ncbi:MAG TPA: HAMP domain-containing sensor histidine kinase [Intrasporangium sp.]|uniref:sensor histidine kinase n=1 Tax=Intrasporangium sp. TaxID=1925024 RepID=UPI002D773BF8|nr:HAMP domain-containing sensor histidine kinase [Intrasporangium sp.]HET7397873.1 HAMP domain-containing sensor histidine kinase [Intrasporangium sp.]